jgi:hypothetical protein
MMTAPEHRQARGAALQCQQRSSCCERAGPTRAHCNATHEGLQQMQQHELCLWHQPPAAAWVTNDQQASRHYPPHPSAQLPTTCNSTPLRLPALICTSTSPRTLHRLAGGRCCCLAQQTARRAAAVRPNHHWQPTRAFPLLTCAALVGDCQHHPVQEPGHICKINCCLTRYSLVLRLLVIASITLYRSQATYARSTAV